MTTLGVFRDDFYNSMAILPPCVYNVLPVETILAGSQMVGAAYVYDSNVAAGNTAVTTDTAINIIAALQNAVAAAVKASQLNGGGFATGLGVPNSPSQFPNLFNVSWLLVIQSAVGLTLTAGVGVTLIGSAVVTAGDQRAWIITVTSPTTVSMQTTGEQITVA
jgi:hypothetical protein